ncbi:MAG: ABC transporter ATP-binding protein [Nitrospinales bacterium]
MEQENLKEIYYDWPLFKRILACLRPYVPQVIISIVLLLAVSLLGLAGPFLTKIAIDDYIKIANYDGLDKIALAYIAILFGSFIFQFAQFYLIQHTGQKVMADLRRRVFAHLHKMSFSFFDKNPIGKLVTRVVNDVEVLNEMLTSGLILVFSDLFTLTGIFCVMLYLDWHLTLLVCVIFPFIYIATQAYRKRARDALRKFRTHVSGLNTALEENLGGMTTVQLFNKEEKQYSEFSGINGAKLKEDLRSLHYNSIYLPSIDMFSAIGIGLIIWYGGGMYVQDAIQLGVLVAFLQYLQKFFEPIRDLAEKFNIIQTAMASSERIFELLDTPEEQINTPQSKQLKDLRGKIEFKNVWFAYNDDNHVLKDVSFSVNEGESLAIIGATGSGKSTIVNALCRFYDFSKGDILIDDISLRKLDKYSLRRHIAMVQQDVFLFSGNISDNIRMGNDDLSAEDIRSFAKAAHSHQFIDSLPSGYQEKILERGASLSQGQKQLLSFARALATDSKILVLDEATSNVDTDTEAMIQQTMYELMKGRTSIIIAHRLSTLRNVDKILALKNGEVAEFGTRDELIKRKGIYYNLMRLQAENIGGSTAN